MFFPLVQTNCDFSFTHILRLRDISLSPVFVFVFLVNLRIYCYVGRHLNNNGRVYHKAFAGHWVQSDLFSASRGMSQGLLHVWSTTRILLDVQSTAWYLPQAHKDPCSPSGVQRKRFSEKRAQRQWDVPLYAGQRCFCSCGTPHAEHTGGGLVVVCPPIYHTHPPSQGTTATFVLSTPQPQRHILR